MRELAKEHTVKLGDGSGVLINGSTDAYSYVLTAKHVVMGCGTNEDKNCVDCSACTKKNDCSDPECGGLSITRLNGDKLIALEMYYSQKWDALILKVPFQEDLKLAASFDRIKHNAAILLLGYPKIERNSNTADLKTQIRLYDCIENDQTSEIRRIIVLSDTFVNQTGIAGFSGGGLFELHEETGSLSLIGIEHRMDNDRAQNGYICGVLLSAYTELIEKNKLEELKPLHLRDFKHSEDAILDSVGLECADSLDSVKQFLKFKLQHHIYDSELSPERILEGFCQKILTYRQCEKKFHDPELWVSFLEFIAVQLVVNPPVSFDEGWENVYLTKLFSSYGFFYSKSIRSHRNIYRELLQCSDMNAISKDARILLFVSGESPDSPELKTQTMSRTKKDITRGLEGEDIANVQANLKRKNKLIHWRKLNDVCLGQKEEFYAEQCILDNEDDIHNKISADYGEYLGKQGE